MLQIGMLEDLEARGKNALSLGMLEDLEARGLEPRELHVTNRNVGGFGSTR
jgi:hypothetical protein